MIGHLGAVAFTLFAATKKTSSSSSSAFVIFIIVIFAALYFLFLRPQQQRARKQREEKSAAVVGDEILTIGGIVGRVVETHDDRVVIVTGETAEDGSATEGTPTRIELVRTAISRKIEPPAPTVPEGASGLDEAGQEDDYDEDEDEDDEAGEHEHGEADVKAEEGTGG